MARPSTWNLSSAERISLPRVLGSALQNLARAIDTNEPETAKQILEQLLAQHCDLKPANVEEAKEGSFTCGFSALVQRVSNSDDEFFLDDEPIPDSVLSQAFQPEPLHPQNETDNQNPSAFLKLSETTPEATGFETQTDAVVPETLPPGTDAVNKLELATGDNLVASNETTQTNAEKALESNASTIQAAAQIKAQNRVDSVETEAQKTLLQGEVSINDQNDQGALPSSGPECPTLPLLTAASEIKPETDTLSNTNREAGTAAVNHFGPELLTVTNTPERLIQTDNEDTDQSKQTETEKVTKASPINAMHGDKLIQGTPQEEQQNYGPERKKEELGITVSNVETAANLDQVSTENTEASVRVEPEVATEALTQVAQSNSAIQAQNATERETITDTNPTEVEEATALNQAVRATVQELEVKDRNSFSPAETQNDAHNEPSNKPQEKADFEATPVVTELVAAVRQSANKVTVQALRTVNEHEEMALFAQALWQTWQKAVLAQNQGEANDYWGISIELEAIYRDSFAHMSKHRFLYLLENLMQSSVALPQGCLKTCQVGDTEPVMLNEKRVNSVTFFLTGTPEQAQQLKQNIAAEVEVNSNPAHPVSELERLRQERDAHLMAIKKRREEQQTQQHEQPKASSLLGALKRLLT